MDPIVLPPLHCTSVLQMTHITHVFCYTRHLFYMFICYLLSLVIVWLFGCDSPPPLISPSHQDVGERFERCYQDWIVNVSHRPVDPDMGVTGAEVTDLPIYYAILFPPTLSYFLLPYSILSFCSLPSIPSYHIFSLPAIPSPCVIIYLAPYSFYDPSPPSPHNYL